MDDQRNTPLLIPPSQDEIEAIRASDLFDAEWYLETYPDVKVLEMEPAEHYLFLGVRLNRDPSPKFNTLAYLASNADVVEQGINPLLHYIRKRERHRSKNAANVGLTRVPKAAIADKTTGALQTCVAGASHIRGELNASSPAEPCIDGWLAKMGDNAARVARLTIDGEEMRVTADLFIPHFLRDNVNNGHHGFSLIVPQKFVDGCEKKVELFDHQTGMLIATVAARWKHSRTFTDFAGFLASSMVAPLVHAPFREEDKRCFAVTENLARHLSERALALSPQPLVSVIMPVRDRDTVVLNSVESVLRQRYVNLELIAIDDGSCDRTYDTLHEIHDPRMTVLRNDTSAGVSSARNTALRAATGSYIAYLDSDNIWDDRYLSAMVGAFAERPEVDALYSGQFLYRGEMKQPFAARFGHFNRALLENRNYIDMNAFCHTRELGERLGGFNEKLSRYVDYDLILRASEIGTMASVPILLSHYYFGKTANTITNNEALGPQIDQVRNLLQHRLSGNKPARVVVEPTKKVSIIIPSYQALDDIRECLEAIWASSLCWVEVIVVDNASDDDVRNFLSGLSNAGKIRLIQNDFNYGFTYAINQGMQAADTESDILLMNNDAVVTHGAIEEMQTHAYRLDQAAVVVPRQVLPGGTKTINEHVPYADQNRACDVNLSAHHQNIVDLPVICVGGPVELSFAPFFCAYIVRDWLRKVGELDAEHGRHYRSDRIFCEFVRHVLGGKVYYVPTATVYHKLQKSTEVIRRQPKADNLFETMFRRNRWDENTAHQLGFREPAWDIR